MYAHEPFDQYTSKVEELCRKLWPSATEAFTIERLQGGSFNRIIGITTPASTSNDQGSYILRIPRWDQGQQARELAILRFVREHTSIPVANVVRSDSSDDNPLGSSYVIQNRLAGTNLFYTFRSLTFAQQACIARDFGRVLVSQQAVKNEKPGIVEACISDKGTYSYDVYPFPVDPEPNKLLADDIYFEAPTVRDMFINMFQRQIASIQQHFPSATTKVDFFRQLADVAIQMDAAGLFKDVPYCLCHLDLEPRNVMVDSNNDTSATISGILDWDSAVFAPIFIACRPPSWLWAWVEDEDEDTSKANDTPATPELQEVKRIFEETVGPQFLKYSYSAEYRLARKLFDLAKGGIGSNEAYDEAEDLIKGWNDIKSSVNLAEYARASKEEKLDIEGAEGKRVEKEDKGTLQDGRAAADSKDVAIWSWSQLAGRLFRMLFG
ncbi:MAG: hypothetical protein Q9219_001876 [cf. Caloplaca sp. 3 TL-2023]